MRVAIIGGGYMGGGMAQVFARHGIACRVADLDAAAAQAAVARIVDETSRLEEQGLLEPGAAAAVAAGVRPAESLEEAVDGADYVAEVVPEAWSVKEATLARASAVAAPDAVIASNTSAIPIARLAGAVAHPERFLGVHWMNPAPFVPGVEVIPGEATDPAVVERVEDLLARIGKVPVRVADAPGFVASRLQYALLAEACRIVEEGHVSAREVDAVVTSTFGFRLAFFGPFAIADMAGLDVYAGGFATLADAYGERFEAPAALSASIAAGRLGVKAGGGLSGLDPALADSLAAYRTRAYAALAALTRDLGPAPGS